MSEDGAVRELQASSLKPLPLLENFQYQGQFEGSL